MFLCTASIWNQRSVDIEVRVKGGGGASLQPPPLLLEPVRPASVGASAACMTRPQAGVIAPVPSTGRSGISTAPTGPQTLQFRPQQYYLAPLLLQGLITTNDFLFLGGSVAWLRMNTCTNVGSNQANALLIYLCFCFFFLMRWNVEFDVFCTCSSERRTVLFLFFFS